ncbi:MAG: hypothetical protein ACAI35_27735, partial [Candidatus Methylacidiphilales bacterium]
MLDDYPNPHQPDDGTERTSYSHSGHGHGHREHQHRHASYGTNNGNGHGAHDQLPPGFEALPQGFEPLPEGEQGEYVENNGQEQGPDQNGYDPHHQHYAQHHGHDQGQGEGEQEDLHGQYSHYEQNVQGNNEYGYDDEQQGGEAYTTQGIASNFQQYTQLQPGERLDQFEIVREVAHGGMGTVYKARDTTLDRVVAIKILHDTYAASPQHQAQFLQEARAAAVLRHTNIVPLYYV